MIIRIQPPKVMTDMVKARSEEFQAAEALANQAGRMLKVTHRALWDLIACELPEVKNSAFQTSCDHTTGIITLSGATADIEKVTRNLKERNAELDKAQSLIVMEAE